MALTRITGKQVLVKQSGVGAVATDVQTKLSLIPAAIADYSSVTDAMSSGGMFAKDEGASGDVWYWGRYMSGAKSTGAGARNLGYGPAGFQFDIRQDDADCGADFMRTLHGRTVFGGSSVKGGRIGVLGEVLQNNGATNSANANRNYVGIVGTAHSEAGDGGTDTGAGSKGAYFGLNGIGRLAAGATNVFEVAGCELNTYVDSTASAKYIFGATISGFNETHAAVLEAALGIGGGTDAGFGPHVGWNYGIVFSDIHGADPTNVNTKLIAGVFVGGGGVRTIAAGLDTSAFNCTSGIVLGQNLVLTDNTLNLGANGANVSTIQAGNNVAAANLDVVAKGGGGVRLKDGTGASRIIVDQGVGIRLIPLASATPTNNGDLAIQATSNTSLTFKFKGSDGTVRSASLTLA